MITNTSLVQFTHSPECMCFPRDVIRPSILWSLDSISSCRQNAEMTNQMKISSVLRKTLYCAITMLQHVTHFLCQGVARKMTPQHGRSGAEQCDSRSTGFCCPCPSEYSPVSWSEHSRQEEKHETIWNKTVGFTFFISYNIEHSILEQRASCLWYLVMWEGDGCIKHGPEDALVAGWSGEGALVSEEMVEVLGQHGAHINVRYVHGLTC